MRLLALLFALYFTVLGCLPCADAEPCASQPGTTAVVRAARHDGGSQGGIDWCSPLCQCQCCAGFALPTVGPVVSFAARPAVRYSVLRFAAQPGPAVTTRAPATPWQPPQGA